jgi:hypothetical protein
MRPLAPEPDKPGVFQGAHDRAGMVFGRLHRELVGAELEDAAGVGGESDHGFGLCPVKWILPGGSAPEALVAALQSTTTSSGWRHIRKFQQ